MPEVIAFHAFPLAGIDAMSASTARAFPRHTHDQYGVGVVDAGGHASWSGRGQVEAGPGHFICVNPGEVHDGRAIGGGSRAWRILYFDPMELTNLCVDVLAGKSGASEFIAPVFADPGLHRLFDDAFHYRAGQDGTMPCETAVLQLVARLGFHSTIRPVRAEGSVPSICRARERIDADWRPPSCCLSMAST